MRAARLVTVGGVPRGCVSEGRYAQPLDPEAKSPLPPVDRMTDTRL